MCIIAVWALGLQFWGRQRPQWRRRVLRVALRRVALRVQATERAGTLTYFALTTCRRKAVPGLGRSQRLRQWAKLISGVRIRYRWRLHRCLPAHPHRGMRNQQLRQRQLRLWTLNCGATIPWWSQSPPWKKAPNVMRPEAGAGACRTLRRLPDLLRSVGQNESRLEVCATSRRTAITWLLRSARPRFSNPRYRPRSAARWCNPIERQH